MVCKWVLSTAQNNRSGKITKPLNRNLNELCHSILGCSIVRALEGVRVTWRAHEMSNFIHISIPFPILLPVSVQSFGFGHIKYVKINTENISVLRNNYPPFVKYLVESLSPFRILFIFCLAVCNLKFKRKKSIA